MRRGYFCLDAQLEFPLEGICALFGKSGCGKTSILRSIAGLDRHNNAFVNFNGYSWQDTKHFVPVHQRRVAYIPQSQGLLGHLSVQKNIEYSRARAHEPGQIIGIDEVVHRFDLQSLLNSRPSQLSGGEYKKVMIARALVNNPRLLLLDEPLNGLDLVQKNDILTLLKQVSTDFLIPMIYVSHDSDEIATIADYLVFFPSGGRPITGEVNRILTDLTLDPAGRKDAVSSLAATVSSRDTFNGLVHLDIGGTTIKLPMHAYEPGSKLRLRIRASDVSISLSRHEDSSIQNIIPAVIIDYRRNQTRQYQLVLKTAGQRLLARITESSFNKLDLKRGSEVFAQIKAISAE